LSRRVRVDRFDSNRFSALFAAIWSAMFVAYSMTVRFGLVENVAELLEVRVADAA
jgi:hypothetical protein